MVYGYLYKTKIGDLMIEENGEGITRISLTEQEDWEALEKRETPLLQEAIKQINGYLAGETKAFDLPLSPQGTAFQQKVWQALRQIPYGETRSYKQVAEAIGQPNASRAVGGANNKNPLMIVVPCHRVVGAKGDLVGYAGGIEVKAELLQIEASHKK